MRLRFIIIFLITVCLASCVSKKKYAALEEQNKQVQLEKTALEEILSRIAVLNDSLEQENTLLDSLLTMEREKSNVATANKKDIKAGKTRSKSKLSKKEEYNKKAVFLYNFAAYVSWPKMNASKFTIGIAGTSEMNSVLAGYTYGKTIGNMEVLVKPYINPSETYQVIFISSSAQKDFQRIKKELSGKPVLVVTENSYLEKLGAHISFYVDGAKVGFTVNKPAIEKSGMNVSAKLLNFAEGN